MAGQDNRAGEEWFGVDIKDLSARLRFNPDDAHIWLAGERMMLLHVASFAHLRRELIERLGHDEARQLLFSIGGVSGSLDAAIARKAMPQAGPIEAFKAGPRLHAIEGIVQPSVVNLEIDQETGFHAGEWIWHNSAEAEAHLQAMGRSAEPVCWTQVGYASAYASAFIGRPVIYREVECKAMGAPHCRIIGRPAAMWEDRESGGTHLAIDLTEVERSGEGLDRAIAPDRASMARKPADLMVGASAIFASILRQIEDVAPLDAPVLIVGEPGVGKKSTGRAIHNASPRRHQRLVAVNCAGFDEDALEIELFGKARTADEPGRQGLAEKAAGGTLLLEDIQEMPPRCQAKLLQLLDGEVRRKGEPSSRSVNVRVIACANERLKEATRDRRFREDLYFRLSVCPIFVPPLRERRSDLPVLIRHFLEHLTVRYGKRLEGVTMDAVGYLLTHELQGNVAELKSMMERAVIRARDGDRIGTAHLQSPADLHTPTFYRISQTGQLVQPGASEDPGGDLLEQMLRGEFDLETFENKLIGKAVAQCNGNLAKAAKLLGISRPKLAYRYGKIDE